MLPQELAALGIDSDRLEVVIAPWLDRFCAWERHLKESKAMTYGGQATDVAYDDHHVAAARRKLQRRMAFVLGSAWAEFPTNALRRRTMRSLQDEQSFIVDQVPRPRRLRAGLACGCMYVCVYLCCALVLCAFV